MLRAVLGLVRPGDYTPQNSNCTSTKTIQVRWTKHTRHCWRRKDELLSNVLLWNKANKQIFYPLFIQLVIEVYGLRLIHLCTAISTGNRWKSVNVSILKYNQTFDNPKSRLNGECATSANFHLLCVLIVSFSAHRVYYYFLYLESIQVKSTGRYLPHSCNYRHKQCCYISGFWWKG